ncbi:MAG: hypothetical protein PVSMB7_06060 [Chloroflexota bacterium]
MSRQFPTRILFFVYLYAFGALCVASALNQNNHMLLIVVVFLGVLTIPLVTWRLIGEVQSDRRDSGEKVVRRERQNLEEQLRALANEAPSGLFLLDLNGRIVETNGAMQSMLGYREEELAGKALSQFVLRSDVDTDAHLFEALVAKDIENYQVDKRFLQQNEEVLWGSLTASLVHDTHGKPQYVAIMVKDTTEQRQEGTGLRDIEQLFRLTFDQAAVGIGHTDRDGRFMFVNRRLCELLACKREELFGRKFRMVVHPDDVDAAEGALNKLLANELEEYAGEIRILQRSGAYVWGNVTMSLMRQPDGEPKYGIIVIEDATERRAAEEERGRLLAREEEARAMSEAASVIRGVVQASPLPILTMGLDGTVQSWNQAATRTFGWREDQVVGKTVPFASDGGASESGEFRRRALNGESITNLEVSRQTKNGEHLDLYMSTAPVRDAHGQITGFMFVYADVTARKRAERELEHQRDFALQVMNTMGQGLAVTDANGRFEYVNPAYAHLLGCEPEALIGRSAYDFTHHHDRGVLDQALAAQRDGKPATYETRVQTSQGEELYLFNTNVPRWRDNRVVGAIAVATDLTGQIRTKKALAEARDQALESSRLKSEFLATMSHEIRTPMNGIIGTLELLNDTELDTEQSEYVDVVDRSSHALLTIINDILDFSKLEADKLVLDSIDFEPFEIVEGAAELLAAPAREKGLSLMTFVDPALPPALRGDPHRLRQILLNLLGNAVKFTERGEIVLEVTREAESEGTVSVRFAVQDTGIGLDDAARARLFRPFVQADGSTTRKYGGTGLGLAICKRLAESMGGAIGVDSVEGRGSTFWFTAQLEIAERASDVTIHPGLQGKRVLIVDENVLSRGIVRRMTESWGMTGTEVGSAREALHLLALSTAQPYDLIISEYLLPDMDGSQLGRAVRQDPASRGIKMVMLTAADRRGQGEAVVEEGFVAFVTKPAKRPQLLNAVMAAIVGTPAATPAEAPAVEPASPTVQGGTTGSTPVPTQSPVGQVVDQVSATRAEQVPVTQAVSASPAVPATGGASDSRALILLVEDNDINQLMALRQLEKLGHDVHIVSNGLQAVKALTTSSRYDLVFMDCQMPEMDGYDATRTVRSAEVTSGRHIPIIAMTANAMGGDRETCIAAGMDDYIAKPVTREILRDALARWLPRTAPSGSTAEALAG